VQIGGWYLSDSQSDLKRFRIPNGTSLTPGGFVVFYQNQFGPADGETDTPPLFTFNSAHGDSVFLSQADAGGNLTGYRTSVSFGASANGVAFGRHATSVGVDFTAMSQPTFGANNPSSVAQFRTGTGAANALPLVGPIVINELMYHPSPSDTNDIDVADEEFIELHNLSGSTVTLYDPAHPENTWRLAGGVSFAFPPNTSIPAGGFLVVVPFDPVTNTESLAAFQSRYGSGAIPVGPYSGKLNNIGDAVELLRPDAPQAPPHPDAGFVPYLVADRVVYSDRVPWPTAADGGGASLQRKAPSDYGNDPANWKAESPTVGRANSETTGSAPVVITPPQSLAVVAGAPAEFRIVASGTAPLQYQWLHNNQPLSGQTATNLELPSVNTNQAGEYRVQVTNQYGSLLSEPAAILTVLVRPAIATPPQSRSVALGGSVLFTVEATGTLPLYFQWQRSGVDLSGQTAGVLAINNAQLADAADYRVVITNLAGATTSAPVTLAVWTPPSLTSQPQSLVALIAGTARFSVSATGDAPLAYQWKINGTNLSGATGQQLILGNLKFTDAGTYAVTVSNHAGLATSQSADLWVIEAPLLSAPLTTAADEFRFDLAGPTNLRYLIEISTNLLHWSPVGSYTSTNSVTTIVDQSATDTNRFYRAVVLP
jgi:hypothetical protein